MKQQNEVCVEVSSEEVAEMVMERCGLNKKGYFHQRTEAMIQPDGRSVNWLYVRLRAREGQIVQENKP